MVNSLIKDYILFYISCIILIVLVNVNINAIEIFWNLEEKNKICDLTNKCYWKFERVDYEHYHNQLKKRNSKLKFANLGLFLLLIICLTKDLYSLKKLRKR